MANWTLKRNDNGQSIDLHPQYVWANEKEWSDIAQANPTYTLTGAFDVQEGTKLAGRPITLDSSYARITRANVDKLQDWSNVPELEMTLTHPKGQMFKVIFKQPPLSNVKAIKPVRPIDELPTDKMTTNINLMTV